MIYFVYKILRFVTLFYHAEYFFPVIISNSDFWVNRRIAKVLVVLMFQRVVEVREYVS